MRESLLSVLRGVVAVMGMTKTADPVFISLVAAKLDFKAAQGCVWICTPRDEASIQRAAAVARGEERESECAIAFGVAGRARGSCTVRVVIFWR